FSDAITRAFFYRRSLINRTSFECISDLLAYATAPSLAIWKLYVYRIAFFGNGVALFRSFTDCYAMPILRRKRKRLLAIFFESASVLTLFYTVGRKNGKYLCLADDRTILSHIAGTGTPTINIVGNSTFETRCF